jgi:uncharacterized repeat protein (TIGR02543 family)
MGGSAPIAQTAIPKGAGGTTTFYLQEAATKGGYTFAGWKSVQDGKIYTAGALQSWKSLDVSSDESIIYEAQWTPVTPGTLTIKYNWMGGSALIAQMTIPKSVSGATTFILQGAAKKSGFAFAGWKSVQDGRVYAAWAPQSWKSPSVTSNESIIYEAQWR